MSRNVHGGYEPLPEGVGPGDPIAVSIHLKAPISAVLELRILSRKGAGEPNVLNEVSYISGDGKWQSVTLSVAELPADANEIIVQLRTANVLSAQALVFYADATVFESNAQVGSFFPRVEELESGQAVENEDGTYTMATPTYKPESKTGDAGEGTEPVNVSDVIEGLEPSTTYHFRVVAENGIGLAEGAEKTFTTE